MGSSLPYMALIAIEDAPEDKGVEVSLEDEPF